MSTFAPGSIRPSITTGLLLLAVIAICLVAIYARNVLLLGFLSVLISTLLDMPVTFLTHLGLRRSVAVLLMLAIIISAGIILGALSLPMLSTQTEHLIQQIPTALEKIRPWFRTSDTFLPSKLSDAIELVFSHSIPAALGTVTAVSAVIFIIVLSAFLTANPSGYYNAIKSVLPAPYVPMFERLWSRLKIRLHGWLLGILISMTLMGTMTAIGLRVAGIDNWALLGFLTFLATFVPYLGGIVSAIPGLLLGLAQSPKHLLYAILVYLSVHLVEGYLIEPLVMNRVVSLRPAALLFWLIFFGYLAGPLAVAVATPILVCATTIFHVLRGRENDR